MADVKVYFKNNNIYNLEDMSLLGSLAMGSESQVHQCLELFKYHYNITLAVMGFEHVLRNAMYCVFPDTSIVIHPLDVITMIEAYLRHCEGGNDIEKEIAAGIEEQFNTGHGEIQCKNLYAHQTKAGAMYYYRQWQSHVPLGIECFEHVINTIDYYYEEVFNYFDFKAIFRC